MEEIHPRILAGSLHESQILQIARVPASGLVLYAPAMPHVLAFSIRDEIQCEQDGRRWTLKPACCFWSGNVSPLYLQPGNSAEARVLIWQFAASALPEAMVDLLPSADSSLQLPPIPMPLHTVALVQGLMSCPVAPGLRTLWATGRLIELITHLLPSFPASQRRSGAKHPAIEKAIAFMREHIDQTIGLAEIARAVGASASHLSRLFTRELGHGPTHHLRILRMDHAARMLRTRRCNVTEAALAVGYASLGQFSRTFQEHHGVPPSSLLKS